MTRNNSELLRTPQELIDLSERITSLRIIYFNSLSVTSRQLLIAAAAQINGLGVAMGALISEAILEGVRDPLNDLNDAIDKLEVFLDDIQNLRDILTTIGGVIQLATNIIGLISPAP